MEVFPRPRSEYPQLLACIQRLATSFAKICNKGEKVLKASISSWNLGCKPLLVPTCPCGKLGFRPPAGTRSLVWNDCGLCPIPMVVGVGRHHVVLMFVTLPAFLYLYIQLPTFSIKRSRMCTRSRSCSSTLCVSCPLSSRLHFQLILYTIYIDTYIYIYIYLFIYLLLLYNTFCSGSLASRIR